MSTERGREREREKGGGRIKKERKQEERSLAMVALKEGKAPNRPSTVSPYKKLIDLNLQFSKYRIKPPPPDLNLFSPYILLLLFLLLQASSSRRRQTGRRNLPNCRERVKAGDEEGQAFLKTYHQRFKTRKLERRSGHACELQQQQQPGIQTQQDASALWRRGGSHGISPDPLPVYIPCDLETTHAATSTDSRIPIVSPLGPPFPSLPVLPFPSLPVLPFRSFPSLPFPSLPFPSFPFPSLVFVFRPYELGLKVGATSKGKSFLLINKGGVSDIERLQDLEALEPGWVSLEIPSSLCFLAGPTLDKIFMVFLTTAQCFYVKFMIWVAFGSSLI
ncbi:hypothetical protein H6P81_011188 [Aristolochia fimbriata]|uniref:Uncharacterized protein n=1 Tax=Aristolochia fimbriata TaxID=158543 RepID=A0AAV7EQT8_ARIFI|nr:hypothetical protein H6P81_011188 [Aristolochia fimbriata]